MNVHVSVYQNIAVYVPPSGSSTPIDAGRPKLSREVPNYSHHTGRDNDIGINEIVEGDITI